MSKALLVDAGTLVVWARDARVPAVPDHAPQPRHRPLTGLPAFDWQWRHGSARRRELHFLATALAAADSVASEPDGQGDITVPQVRVAFAAACAAAELAPAAVLFRRVLALLRGCYVVMPAAERTSTLALAAAVAARCGLSVHLVCEDTDSIEPLRTAVAAALAGSEIEAKGLAEQAGDLRLLAGGKVQVVCATVSALAHAWLRGNGDRGALGRAAGWLAGDTAPVFSYAPLLLCADGDRVLLDLLRHPLQLTRGQAEDASSLMVQLVRATASWQSGREFVEGRLTPQGEQALQEAAARHGGPWSVPRLLRTYVQALLVARACELERDFLLDAGRLRWLILPAGLAEDPAAQARVELALRCLHGQPPVPRVRRRAWFIDFFSGYARIGAAGDNLAGEWRDLWWLHAMPVLGNRPRRIAAEWVADTASAVAATAAAPLAVAQSRLLALPGLPADTPSLETRDGSRRAAALAASDAGLRVLGPVLASRQLPPEVSSIILAADSQLLPGIAGRLARRALRWRRAGRPLLRWIAAWLLRQAARRRYEMRLALVARQQQERRTYAFTGDSRDD